jgi:hypothetical protein
MTSWRLGPGAAALAFLFAPRAKAGLPACLCSWTRAQPAVQNRITAKRDACKAGRPAGSEAPQQPARGCSGARKAPHCAGGRRNQAPKVQRPGRHGPRAVWRPPGDCGARWPYQRGWPWPRAAADGGQAQHGGASAPRPAGGAHGAGGARGMCGCGCAWVSAYCQDRHARILRAAAWPMPFGLGLPHQCAVDAEVLRVHPPWPVTSLQALQAKGAKPKSGVGPGKRSGTLLPSQVRRG